MAMKEITEETGRDIVSLLASIKDSCGWACIWLFFIFLSSCGEDAVRITNTQDINQEQSK